MDNITKCSVVIKELSRAISGLCYMMSSDDQAHEWCVIEHIQNALNILKNGSDTY